MALEREDREAIVEAIQAGFKSVGNAQTTGGGGSTGGGGGGGSSTVYKTANDAVDGFGKVLAQGGNSITTFSKEIADILPSFAGTIAGVGTSIAGYLEDTQGAFQGLSKVGIGLNGNLGDLRVQAAKTRMPLDQFAGIVSANSQALVGLGGNATDGAKRFAELSDVMFRDGAIDGFMNLGYSLEESNEFILKNTQLLRRQALQTGMSDQEQIKAASELAKNMTVVAKLTGKDAKQMQDEMMAKQRDGATQASLRLMEMDGVSNATQTFGEVQNILSSGSKTLQNLFSDQVQANAPLTEATQNYAAVNQEAAALAQQARDAMARGDKERAMELAKQAVAAEQEFASSRQGLQIARFAQINEVAQAQANVLEETGDLIDATKAVIDKIKKNTGVELSMREAFVQNLETINTNMETQMSGNQQGQDALNAVNKAQVGLSNTVSDANQKIGEQIQTNSVLLEGFSQVEGEIGKKAKEAMGTIIDGLNNLVPGTTLSENIPLIQMFATELEAAGKDVDAIVANLKTLTDATATQEEKNLARDKLLAAEVINTSGQITAAFAKELQNIREDNQVTQSQAGNNDEGSSLSLIGRMWNSISSWFGDDENSNMSGSGGFKDFGQGSAQLLHDLEAIVPAKSPEGQLLGMANSGALSNLLADLSGGKFDPTQLANEMATTGVPMSEAAQTTMAMANTSKTGATSEDSLDNLNQSVLQLVEINKRTLETANRQLKATKGLDGNLMQSVGI